MKDDTIGLTRRKILGGLGAVGLASAGAGLGTTAYFNDTESFQNNSLTAGEFDLKVDWQQEYYGPSESWEPVNAYPDTNDDGVQDNLETRNEIAERLYGSMDLSQLTAAQRQAVEQEFRAQFADLPGDFEMPVIDLQDVKPGDKGEITISMHLFDNPGYIWFGGSLVENSDNGISEPESEVDDTPNRGDLAEAIQAKLWYDDDCDNKHDTGNACMQLVVDNTDSMGNQMSEDGVFVGNKDDLLIGALENLVDDLDADDDGTLDTVDVGLTLYADMASNQFTPTDDADAVVSGTGLTNTNGLQDITDQTLEVGVADIAEAINTGASALTDCPEDSQRVLTLVTNGVNITQSNFLTVATNNLSVSGGNVDKYVIIGLESFGSESILSAIEGLPGDHEFIMVDDIIDEIEYAITGNGPFTGPDPDSNLAAELQDVNGGETVIAEGTLVEVLDAIDGDSGVLLDSDRSTPDVVDCYPNSTTNCLALLWELPATVGNEVQTDRVRFDLDLYAEQCRHNPNPEEKTPFA